VKCLHLWADDDRLLVCFGFSVVYCSGIVSYLSDGVSEGMRAYRAAHRTSELSKSVSCSDSSDVMYMFQGRVSGKWGYCRIKGSHEHGKKE
jgi:hypothetical protein